MDLININEILFSKRGASFFCWETLIIFCGVGVAHVLIFDSMGRTYVRKNDGFREMVNKLLAIHFIHESIGGFANTNAPHFGSRKVKGPVHMMTCLATNPTAFLNTSLQRVDVKTA